MWQFASWKIFHLQNTKAVVHQEDQVWAHSSKLWVREKQRKANMDTMNEEKINHKTSNELKYPTKMFFEALYV